MTTKKNGASKVFTAPRILSASYFIAGVTLLSLMVQPKYMLVHLGLLGILNILVSYGIMKTGRWSLYLTASTSLLGLVFGGASLAAVVAPSSLNVVDMLTLLGIIAYMALSVVTLIYLALKKGELP